MLGYWPFRSFSAEAQTYPARAVELVVPFAAGGGTDLLARLVAEGLEQAARQSFVTLNRPGGNTNAGTLQVVKSPPDGHTLVMASIGLAANPSLYRKLAFDPLLIWRRFRCFANSPTMLAVPPDVSGQHAAEFDRASEGASRRAELRLLRRRYRGRIWRPSCSGP